MRTICSTVTLIVLLGCIASGRAEAPPIELEVATHGAAPFGAQQKWYSLLKEFDVESLRIREVRRGEEPSIDKAGTDRFPRYRVTAILDSEGRLLLPGGRFSERDRGRLAAYLRKLREEGIDGVTAERGLFGLTEKQFENVHAELSEPVGFATADKRPREIVDALADRLAHRLVIDRSLVGRLDAAEPTSSELEGLSRGTALAIVLRQAGLEFRPQLRSGELLYEVPAIRAQEERPGRQAPDEPPTSWPVGWKPEDIPGRTVPELFERIPAEIDGYTLDEALAAIGSRLKVPLFVDRYRLQEKEIDATDVQVKLPAAQYTYDRILSRILFQGRLTGTIRVDERGTPFYWITAL